MMRRLLLLVTVALVMAVVMMASALPAFAIHRVESPEANCIGEAAAHDPESVVQGARAATPGPLGIGAAASTDCFQR